MSIQTTTSVLRPVSPETARMAGTSYPQPDLQTASRPTDAFLQKRGGISSYGLDPQGVPSAIPDSGDPLSGLAPSPSATSPSTSVDKSKKARLQQGYDLAGVRKKKRKRSRKGGVPIEGSKMDALEAKFGPWSGIGRNKNPRVSTGPKGNALLNGAYEALSQGNVEQASKMYQQAKKTASPVMLDLDGDGKLGTSGVSTARNRIDGQVGKTVSFDIDGDGKKDNIEWMRGGDGMLVDDRDGGATAAMNVHGEIDGKRLFGDEGGKFGNGYDKLKQLDRDGDGKLTGSELDGLKVWVDNGDARIGGGELKSLGDLGVTEISVKMQIEKNARGEDLMQSSFVQDGQRKVTEDVWFAQL